MLEKEIELARLDQLREISINSLLLIQMYA